MPTSVSLRQYCPTPADQGALPASAAYALCHALTIQRAIQMQTFTSDDAVFSASWLFNSLKKGQDCGTGIRLSEALGWMKKHGVCTIRFYPNSRYTCLPVPDERNLPAGTLHRIKNYDWLFDLEDSTMQKVETVRRSLSDIHHPRPAVVVLPINLGFDALASASGTWRLAPFGPTKTVQYEAFVVTGYDDDAQTFELMGSYGTAWGDGGFARIGYRDFGEVVKYGVVLEAGRFQK